MFSSRYLAIFGVLGVCFNPIKGMVLLKAARNFKNFDDKHSTDGIDRKASEVL